MARWLLPLAAALPLLPAACGRPHPIEARPALWRVTNVDTTIYIFGTIHALPDDIGWQSPALARAIDEANLLVTEIPPAQPGAAADTFQRYARRADGTALPFARRLPPDAQGKIERAATRAGLSTGALEKADSWAAAVIIGAALAKDAGADPASGVDNQLRQMFNKAGKPVRALETQAIQLALFDSLPESEQRDMLARAPNAATDYRALLAAWASGDVDTLAAQLDRTTARQPVFRRSLIDARNARWARWVKGRMAQPGTVLVAVGAGHLVGDGSVIAQLEAAGLKVARIQ